jgi:sulfur relay (sulfurtransferase) DsrC/TusE family protein
VFIEDGMVVFVTQYYKGYNVSSNVKIIHRYLPREVGELVVWCQV